MKRRPRTVDLGIFSSGTMRDEDVGDALASLLTDLQLSCADRKTVREFHRAVIDMGRGGAKGEAAEEALPDIVQDLWSALDNYLPPYAYAGSSEGDGACFGVWPNLAQVEEDAHWSPEELVKVAELPPARRTGPFYAAVVTDHGNLTLYRRAGNRWTEVWAVV